MLLPIYQLSATIFAGNHFARKWVENPGADDTGAAMLPDVSRKSDRELAFFEFLLVVPKKRSFPNARSSARKIRPLIQASHLSLLFFFLVFARYGFFRVWLSFPLA